ncbi:BrnT family toxin [Nostoc sp.]|uniref:BrnT family toxin n=1 Tax=Nostoc sp. TaxID=1180 RepID=UPI002FF6B6D9
MPRLWGIDVFFVLNGVTFVWNEEKARINPSNHDGITFQQAVETFFDPFLVVVDASRNDERRDAVIGLDRRWNVLYVVYIERENDMIRIISARKATRKEREYYES